MTIGLDALWAGISGPLGTLFLMLVILVGALRQWWIPGWLYRQEKAEKDEYKALAFRLTGLAERVVRKVEKEDA